jgi:hypothetical protein
MTNVATQWQLLMLRESAQRDIDAGHPLETQMVSAEVLVAMVDEIIENRGLKPRFEHPCPHCRFLGPYNAYDLYYCETATSGTKFIARWSDRSVDWKAFAVTQVTAHDITDPEYVEAKNRAVKLGWFIP